MPEEEEEIYFATPECSVCKRRRTLGDSEHPMDAYDYTPMQVISGQPLGWYSGPDGQVCPEDMTKMMENQ